MGAMGWVVGAAMECVATVATGWATAWATRVWAGAGVVVETVNRRPVKDSDKKKGRHKTFLFFICMYIFTHFSLIIVCVCDLFFVFKHIYIMQ
jgi:hypothetical protein